MPGSLEFQFCQLLFFSSFLFRKPILGFVGNDLSYQYLCIKCYSQLAGYSDILL